jgi:hypothetical protein
MTECECRDGCPCAENPGPAALLVLRNGNPLHVCTRCCLTEVDQVLFITVPTDPPPQEFLEYDLLGCFALSMMPETPERGEA